MFASAFSASVHALNAFTKSFEAISNNVVNISTPGYKDRQVSFSDFVSNRSGTEAKIKNRTQHEGIIVQSKRGLDAAISGRGYFITNKGLGNNNDYLMTASGKFDLYIPPGSTDGTTYIVDNNKNYLMGWLYNQDTKSFNVGKSLNTLSAIKVDANSISNNASPTDIGSMRANLDADAKIGDTKTYSISIFDGTGKKDKINDGKQINFTWTKTANNSWNMQISAKNGTVTAPTAPVNLTFNQKGMKPTLDGNGNKIDINIDWLSPKVNSKINFNLADLTQVAGGFRLEGHKVNGNIEGRLESVFFAKDGILMGKFSNGRSSPIAKIPVGDVIAPENLRRVSGTHFAQSRTSGDIKLYEINTSSRATFIARAFEASSVNLNDEMTKMIITQRAYSSAATSLKTIDEMFKTATDLK